MSNGSGISDPQLEMLRIEIMRTDCTANLLRFTTEVQRILGQPLQGTAVVEDRHGDAATDDSFPRGFISNWARF